MGIHLLKTGGSLHIDGHKEKTIYHNYQTYTPPKVFIPAVDRNGNPLKNLAEDGAHVDRGQLLGLGADDFPTYSSVCGRIVGHKLMRLGNGRVQDCFEIRTDINADYYRAKAPLPAPEICSATQIINAIKDSGVVGMGGAGFPTYLKYKTDKPIRYIIVNAVECEPYLTADVSYSMGNLQPLFYALHYLQRLTACEKIYIAVKKDRPFLIDRLKSEIKDKENRKLPVSLALLPDRYPMGYERTLVKKILHKEYETLPIEVGCVVNNISTLINVGIRFMTGEVATSRNVTVSGSVQNPLDLYVPVGCLASDLINHCGGPTVGEFKLISGGPMCGSAFQSDFVCTMGTNGVLVLPPAHNKPDPCWHCGDCSNHCPVGLQPVQIQLALKAGNVDRLVELHADKCASCGLCSYVCPSRIDVSGNIAEAKKLALEEIAKRKAEGRPVNRDDKKAKKAAAKAQKEEQEALDAILWEAQQADMKAAKKAEKAAKKEAKAAQKANGKDAAVEEAPAAVEEAPQAEEPVAVQEEAPQAEEPQVQEEAQKEEN